MGLSSWLTTRRPKVFSVEEHRAQANEAVRAERWWEALDLYNDIIYEADDREEIVDAYLWKGVLLEELDRPDKARQHYEACLRLDPEFEPARQRLAELPAGSS